MRNNNDTASNTLATRHVLHLNPKTVPAFHPNPTLLKYHYHHSPSRLNPPSHSKPIHPWTVSRYYLSLKIGFFVVEGYLLRVSYGWMCILLHAILWMFALNFGWNFEGGNRFLIYFCCSFSFDLHVTRPLSKHLKWGISIKQKN